MKRYQIGAILALVLLIGGAAIFLLPRETLPTTVQAQETPASMRTLIERLRARMEADANFTASFQFMSPPVPGEPMWIIPAALTEPGSMRRLGEIGSDYVCFTEVGQTFNDSICIPYSNITMVIYQN